MKDKLMIAAVAASMFGLSLSSAHAASTFGCGVVSISCTPIPKGVSCPSSSLSICHVTEGAPADWKLYPPNVGTIDQSMAAILKLAVAQQPNRHCSMLAAKAGGTGYVMKSKGLKDMRHYAIYDPVHHLSLCAYEVQHSGFALAVAFVLSNAQDWGVPDLNKNPDWQKSKVGGSGYGCNKNCEFTKQS